MAGKRTPLQRAVRAAQKRTAAAAGLLALMLVREAVSPSEVRAACAAIDEARASLAGVLDLLGEHAPPLPDGSPSEGGGDLDAWANKGDRNNDAAGTSTGPAAGAPAELPVNPA